MAHRYTVLTAVGPDRPGIVKAISTRVHRAGANLEDSRMAILGGEFALLALIGGDPEALDKVQAACKELGAELGLEVMLRPTARAAPGRDYLAYDLKVTGVDHPGIVQSVTEALTERNVNVASLETNVTYAPLSGTPMFVLDVRLQVPPSVAMAELRRTLAAVCDRENLDFTLNAVR